MAFIFVSLSPVSYLALEGTATNKSEVKEVEEYVQ
jgi:hypothetical protein